MTNRSLIILVILLLFLLFTATPSIRAENLKKHQKQWNKLNSELSHVYRSGNYRKAFELAEEAYQYAKMYFGPEHPDTLTSINNLALSYNRMGRDGEAEPLFKEALQLSEKVLGPEHPTTIGVINNLAVLYRSQGRYMEAEPLYKKALQLSEKVLGPEHPKTLTFSNNLALLYHSLGRYEEAEPLYKNTLQRSAKVLGLGHPNTLALIDNFAGMFKSQGRYFEAEPLLSMVLQLRETVLGPEHPDTLESISHLAKLYMAQGRYVEAEPLFNKAFQLREKVLGPEHPDTQESLNDLAGSFKSQGRYIEAEPLYNKALQLNEKVLGPDHPSTFKSMNDLAGLYLLQGRYGEAEALYIKTLKLCEKVLGSEHPDTLTSINNLAMLYERQGRYGEAEALLIRALQLSEKVLGPEHPKTLTLINNLGRLYNSQGRYGEAEPLLKKALQLKKKVLGPEHPHNLHSFNSLAALYRSQGRNDEAEPLYKEALQLCEKVLGSEHPDAGVSMSGLALLYNSQGRYGEAEPLFKKALHLGEKLFGYEHPDTLSSINNLAQLYDAQGRYSDAEPLYKKALELSEKLLGSEHPSTLTYMSNLAALYDSQGRYSDAESLYIKALQLRKKVLGPEHPEALKTQLNYIVTLIKMKNHRAALRLFKKVEGRLLSRSFQELYNTSTDRIRRLYLKMISNFQDAVLSFAVAYPQESHQKYAANIMLRWKQIYAQESAYQYRLMQLSQDPLLEKINSLRASFSRQVHHPVADSNIEALWLKLNQTEQRIREKAKMIKSGLEVASANTDKVLGQLNKESALIEFKTYIQLNFKTAIPLEIRLAACLFAPGLKANQQVIFKDLGTMAEMLESINRSNKQNSSAYDFLLGRFDQKIKGLKSIYIAPDGILNLISFASLQLADGRYLIQRQQINRVMTGRDFLSKSGRTASNELIAFGGVDYSTIAADDKFARNNDGDPTNLLNKRANAQLDGFSNLKHTGKEASRIAAIFETHCKDGKAKVYKKTEASEYRLKNLKNPPRILHFATHGFFLKDKEISQWSQEAPLMLSGLALAGANEGLRGKLDINGDDGLLFSMEVLGLNLQGTELVSLSACDTGKGVIDYSEGVYGLVRAFKTAGAQNILMTLRPVGDRSSREFMETFYDFWLSAPDGSGAAEALHKTRLAFIAHANEKYRSPNIWSPYVIVGK